MTVTTNKKLGCVAEFFNSLICLSNAKDADLLPPTTNQLRNRISGGVWNANGRKRSQAQIVAPAFAFVLAFRQSYTTEP
jgi:hypothetical protein